VVSGQRVRNGLHRSESLQWNQRNPSELLVQSPLPLEAAMAFGKGVLLWLIGIPLPINLLLALFMHH
jgi:hypothetical protein